MYSNHAETDNGVGISSDVIRICSEEGIPIHFLSGRGSAIAWTSVLGLVSARLPLLSPPAPAPAKVRMKRTPSIPPGTTLPDGPGSVAFSHTLTKKTQMPTVQQVRDYKRKLLQRQQHTKTTMRNME